MQNRVNDLSHVLSLIDLTRLEDLDADDGAVRALCRSAFTPIGRPAAVCIYPQYIAAAREALQGQDPAHELEIATVVNFPEGRADLEHVVHQTEEALRAGATEIDLVFPYRALVEGDRHSGHRMVERCKHLCGERTLKVILETGELRHPSLIRLASRIAIDAGANFLKTSTGKVAVNATPEAASCMLSVIAEHAPQVGFKAAGGIRTLEDAEQYMAIATRLLGEEYVVPSRFRLGASSLLGDLLSRAGGQGDDRQSEAGY